MDIYTLLNELRSEREALERAIIALERIGGRRGRLPKWMKAHEEATQTEQKKKQIGRSRIKKN